MPNLLVVGENDFESWCINNNKEFLLNEWDYDKNEGKPSAYAAHAGKKVWWKCPKGHSFFMSVDKRTGKDQLCCPYCSNQKVLSGYNDLATVYPEVAEEWDYEKNNPYTPNEIAKKSNRSFWWVCKTCGRSYKAIVYNRVTGHGCPYCANQKAIEGENDLQTLFPEIAKEWDYQKNTGFTNEVMGKSHKKVWWRCSKGHSYFSSIATRTHQNSGCPICNGLYGTSFQEQSILFYLSRCVKTINRYILEDVEIDIFLPDYSIGIEYDGQYYHSNDHASKKEKYKNDKLKKLGIELFRVKEASYKNFDNPNILFYIYKENNENLDEVILELLSNLRSKIYIPELIDVDCNRDRVAIMGQYMYTKKEESLLISFPDLMKEWNYGKNQDIKSESISPGSHQKVWWICSKGHEWQAQVKSRTKNMVGCPYCSNKKVLPGFNDLATTNPELLGEWDYSRNTIDPTTITAGTNHKVWWKCKACGNQWQAVILSRKHGYGCPICGHKKGLANRKARHGY